MICRPCQVDQILWRHGGCRNATCTENDFIAKKGLPMADDEQLSAA
jgi:hypothetical protein